MRGSVTAAPQEVFAKARDGRNTSDSSKRSRHYFSGQTVG